MGQTLTCETHRRVIGSVRASFDGRETGVAGPPVRVCLAVRSDVLLGESGHCGARSVGHGFFLDRFFEG